MTRVQALGGAMSSPVGWSRYLGGGGGGEAQDEDVKGFYLRTRETLQVVGRHNLWAAGDAMLQERRGKEGGQVRQVKNAHTAEQTAKLAAVNIVRAIREDGGRRVGAEWVCAWLRRRAAHQPVALASQVVKLHPVAARILLR